MSITFEDLRRVSVTMPDPTLDDQGNVVQPWTPALVTADVGIIRVFFGATDVTEVRAVPTRVEEWSSQLPFGDWDATIVFPGVGHLDQLGAGDLAAIVEDVNVDIRLDDGTTETTLWEGYVDAFESDDNGLTVACIGAGRQVREFVRLQGLSNEPIDIGTLIATQYEHDFRPSLRCAELAVVATGVTSTYRGNGERTDECIARWLEQSIDSSGNQYTINIARPRTPVLQLKDRVTEHWTVWAKGPGVRLRVQREKGSGANVIYGQGVDGVGGATWRNSFPDQPPGFPFYQPLAYDPLVHGYDEDANGDLVDNTVRLDTTILRREAHFDFGEGFTLAEAKAYAEAFRVRGQDPGWLGELALGTDPAEGSKLTMRAGQNVRIRGQHGTGAGRLYHISALRIRKDGDRRVAVATIDTKARDADLLEALIEQRKDAAKNPISRLIVGKESRQRRDRTIPWDASAGAGVIPNDATYGHRHKVPTATVPCPADAWRIVRFLASERDTVVKTRVVLDVARAFHVSFYDRLVTVGDLPSNPMAAGAPFGDTPGFLIGWGGYGDRAGFFPGRESRGSAVTGEFRDELHWSFDHDDVDDADEKAYLYMAVWVVGGTANLWAQLHRGPGSD